MAKSLLLRGLAVLGLCLTLALGTMAGDRGTTGDKGTAGDKGAKGTPGDRGTAGDKGAKGTTGDKGTTGKGTTGDKGTTGKGTTGGEGSEKLDGLTDEQFAMKAAEADLVEITLGKVAMDQATSTEVKKYGQQMVEDHTKSSKELMAIVAKKSIKITPKIDAKHQDAMAKLLVKKGAEFDRAYMDHMVMDHKKVLALYQHQAKAGKDEDLKAFAAKGAPIVEGHLKMAMQIQGMLDKGGKGTEKGATIRDGGR